MALEHRQRELTPAESRFLRRELAKLRTRRRAVLWRTTLIWLVLGAAFVTFAGPYSRSSLVAAVVLAVALVLAAWSLWEEQRRGARWRRSVDSAAAANKVGELRITASAVVEFEEFEDEGACYAFQIAPGEIVFVQGQDFYSNARFPSDDFSLITIFEDDGRAFLTLTGNRGRRLMPRSVVATNRVQALQRAGRYPDHLQRAAGEVDDAEAILLAGPPAA